MVIWLRHMKSVQGQSENFSLSRKDHGKCALQGFKLRYTGLSIDRTLQNIDGRVVNLPPINMNFQHLSAMISMSTGNLVPSKAPCPYNLKTNESKHWKSLCDTCDISYACMTRHAILWHAYNAFNGQNSLVKGLSALIEHYVTSTTAHHTPQSSNHIGCNCNSSFGLRSCQKHVTSHSSVWETSIHLRASS